MRQSLVPLICAKVERWIYLIPDEYNLKDRATSVASMLRRLIDRYVILKLCRELDNYPELSELPPSVRVMSHAMPLYSLSVMWLVSACRAALVTWKE